MHILGYRHRDIKPDNIVLNIDPLDVKVIDFNTAVLDSVTSQGTPRGTPGYFPLASYWYDNSRKWDIWALAATICEADMPLDIYLNTKTEKEAK